MENKEQDAFMLGVLVQQVEQAILWDKGRLREQVSVPKDATINDQADRLMAFLQSEARCNRRYTCWIDTMVVGVLHLVRSHRLVREIWPHLHYNNSGRNSLL